MLKQSEMSRDTGFWHAVRNFSLAAKLVLAVISVLLYWLVSLIHDSLDLPDVVKTALGHLPGLIFGVLVMGPYAAALRMRVLRILAMAVASELIYDFAVQFVIEGPFSYNTITPFLISGAGAALLVGLAVVLAGWHRLRWRLVGLTLAAGLIGGGAFEWIPSGGSDWGILGGHLAWQILVCLALHLGLQSGPQPHPRAA